MTYANLETYELITFLESNNFNFLRSVVSWLCKWALRGVRQIILDRLYYECIILYPNQFQNSRQETFINYHILIIAKRLHASYPKVK